MTLSNQPIKGTADWLPDEYRIRKYIFDTWRTVCTRYGYQEYLTPLLEPAELYRAKSGEDVGGIELTTLTDRAGRELAIRPEMTPSVTRLVSKIFSSTPKPIRLFSIANFFRNENPQRGRNREFWQLNFDIFGSDLQAVDLEILQMALDIMLAFNPPADSFTLNLNDRRLIDAVIPPSANRQDVVRIMDKFSKLPENIFRSDLKALNCTDDQVEKIFTFLSCSTPEDLITKLPELANNPGYQNCLETITNLSNLGYTPWVKFRPNIIRGFDYYDGMVFEIFDNHPKNSRAMFGGGRYNGLASLFGIDPFPAVGCAPGDETTRLFLESWQILPADKSAKYYLPILDENTPTSKIASHLRQQNFTLTCGLVVETITKALQFALKNNYTHLVIYGSQEAKNNEYSVKDLTTQSQVTHQLT